MSKSNANSIKVTELERPCERKRELHKLLHFGDPDGDSAFRILKLDASDRALSQLETEDPELFKRLLEVPEWVDWELLQLGQEIFRRYFTAMFASLSVALLTSFLNVEINRVLLHSNYWVGSEGPASENSLRNNFRRLVETANWVFSTSETGEMLPLGKGWRLTLRVRLLHSQVRKHILKQVVEWGQDVAGQRAIDAVESRPSAKEIHYNNIHVLSVKKEIVDLNKNISLLEETFTKKAHISCPYAHSPLETNNSTVNGWKIHPETGWDGLGGGVPINQLHLRSTLMSFHGFPIKILRHQFGVQLSQRELEGFTMHWRWVAHLLGIQDELAHLESYQESEQWDQTIMDLTFKTPDQTSVIMTRQVLTTYRMGSEMARIGWSKWWIDVFRMTIGNEMADQLEIPPASPLQPLVSIIFRSVGWVYRLTNLMGLNSLLLSTSKMLTRWTIERKCHKFGINPRHIYPPFPW